MLGGAHRRDRAVVDAVGSDGKERELFRVEPVRGKPLELTLDARLQQEAERLLAGVGPASAVVALRPSTGAVLAAIGVTGLLAVESLPVAYAGAALWGLGISIGFPLAMSAAGETPGRGASAIATVATIAYAGFLVGPPLLGSVAHATSLDAALWVVVLLTVGIFVLAGNARSPRRGVRSAAVRG